MLFLLWVREMSLKQQNAAVDVMLMQSAAHPCFMSVDAA